MQIIDWQRPHIVPRFYCSRNVFGLHSCVGLLDPENMGFAVEVVFLSCPRLDDTYYTRILFLMTTYRRVLILPTSWVISPSGLAAAIFELRLLVWSHNIQSWSIGLLDPEKKGFAIEIVSLSCLNVEMCTRSNDPLWRCVTFYFLAVLVLTVWKHFSG